MYRLPVVLLSFLILMGGAGHLSQAENPPIQDILIQKDGKKRVGEVLSRTQSGNTILLDFKFEGGQLPIPMDNLRSITLQERPAFIEGARAYRNGDFDKAIPLLKKAADPFLGIDAPWIGEAVGMLTDALTQQKKTFEAKEYGDKLKTFFPDSPFRFKADIIRARTMLEPGKVDQAIAILTETKTKLPQVAVPQPVTMSVLGDLHLALAEAHLIKGDKQKALENYLLVATVYHQPESQARQAREQANKLRQQDPKLAVN